MSTKCSKHPGLAAVSTVFKQTFCQKCSNAQQKAIARVDRHVEPKDCFITYAGGYDWRPFDGTGCAHWVAHEKKITAGSPSSRCLAGHTIRVRDLLNHVQTKQVKDRSQVKVGDIWIAIKGVDWTDHDHCGIVIQVTPVTDQATGTPGAKMTIKHDSSGQGRVAQDDLDQRFKGKGRFFRYP